MWGGRIGALPRVGGSWLTEVLGRKPLSCNAASLKGNNSPQCWNCGGPGNLMRGNGFFCPQCRALQPPDPTRDHFSLMDCNRSFRVDTAKLQHRYQQLQRLVHPDFFSQRSQTEKDFSEKHSTLVNDAYKTLLAPLSRGLYLLKLHGVEIPEGTDYEMDKQFLMEIMDINEKLAEAQSEAAMKEIECIVRAKQKELTDIVSRAFEEGLAEASVETVFGGHLLKTVSNQAFNEEHLYGNKKNNKDNWLEQNINLCSESRVKPLEKTLNSSIFRW